MSKQSPITITTRWDRPAVPTGKGETWLVVSIKSRKRRANARRQPVDVSFVIDRSGSMTGQPLDLARRGVIDALSRLEDLDRFGVVAYDHTAREVVPFSSAFDMTRRRAGYAVAEISAGGSTDLFGGWRLGFGQHRYADRTHVLDPVSGAVRRIILLTDGLANVGLTDPGSIFQHVTAARTQGVLTSTLGLGTMFNAELLSGMAEAGGGNFAYVEHTKDLPAFFARELSEALAIVASGATLTLNLPKGIRARLLNPFPVTRTGKQLSIALGDIPAGMNLDLVFQVTTRAKSEGPVPNIDLSGRWLATDPAREELTQVGVDPIMVLNPRDFEAMPRDAKASEAVTELVAAEAKREAIRQFRVGNVAGARSTLDTARDFTAAAPSARSGLLSEINTLRSISPESSEFENVQRKVLNDEHRRTRGRDL